MATPPVPKPHRRGESSVDDAENVSHHLAQTKGIRMLYVEAGRGPLVILLHGYPFLRYLRRHQIKATSGIQK
jgi:hypothetical protein